MKLKTKFFNWKKRLPKIKKTAKKVKKDEALEEHKKLLKVIVDTLTYDNFLGSDITTEKGITTITFKRNNKI